MVTYNIIIIFCYPIFKLVYSYFLFFSYRIKTTLYMLFILAVELYKSLKLPN